MERVEAITCPFQPERGSIRRQTTGWITHLIVFTIYALTLPLTAVSFLGRGVIEGPAHCPGCPKTGSVNCSYTWNFPDEGTFLGDIDGPWFCAQAVLGVFLPLLLLMVLNTVLVRYLHSRAAQTPIGSTFRAIRARQERRVTRTVVLVILAFTVLNLPSGIVRLCELSLRMEVLRRAKFFYDVAEAANVLVVLGKVVNFFLYCFSSGSFRSKLVRMFGWKRKSNSSMKGSSWESSKSPKQRTLLPLPSG